MPKKTNHLVFFGTVKILIITNTYFYIFYSSSNFKTAINAL